MSRVLAWLWHSSLQPHTVAQCHALARVHTSGRAGAARHAALCTRTRMRSSPPSNAKQNPTLVLTAQRCAVLCIPCRTVGVFSSYMHACTHSAPRTAQHSGSGSAVNRNRTSASGTPSSKSAHSIVSSTCPVASLKPAHSASPQNPIKPPEPCPTRRSAGGCTASVIPSGSGCSSV
jgi:hypothetical protein